MSDEKLEIIIATPSDILDLQNISKQTFVETFASLNTESDMQEYLEKAFAITTLTDQINNTNSAFYFGKINKKVIGYFKINFGQAQTELKDNNAFEIERIFVSKEFQGKRIGQSLLDKIIQLARSKKLNYIWLGVWEKNLKAIEFYIKNGFVTFDKHIFILGNDEQIDSMMKLEL